MGTKIDRVLKAKPDRIVGPTMLFFLGGLLIAGLLLAAENAGVKPKGTRGGEMVLVAGGEFKMGCNRRADSHCDADENPYHTVSLPAFYLDRFEATNAEYQECVKAKTCRPARKYQGFDAPNQPAVGVAWADASAYCKWAGKRLPTEAEWEKAARGADGRVYPWGNSACGCACAIQESKEVYGCGKDATWPVGSTPRGKSFYGAEDMAGNVWEWVSDWYDPKYYAGSPKENPPGPATGMQKVRRGGSYANIKNYFRASDRSSAAPETVSNSTGFRCAMTAP